MAPKLTASVGRRGKNVADDVKTVQKLLNAFAGKLKFPKLAENGKPSPALEKAIGTFQEKVCLFKPDFRIDPGKATIKKLTAGVAKAEAERKAEAVRIAKQQADQHKKAMEAIKKAAIQKAKQNNLDSKSWSQMYAELEQYVSDSWDSFVKQWEKSGAQDQKALAKAPQDLVKDGTKLADNLTKKYAQDKPSNKTPLELKGTEAKIKDGGFSFTVSGKSGDTAAKTLLVISKNNLTMDISKGWTKSMLPQLLTIIDKANLWGKSVSFRAAETTNGKLDPKSLSKPVILRTPVAPFKGTVSLAGLGADKGMTYTGNGTGRYLYTKPINGWYFLKYGSNFERDPSMRGFDCITYVGSAFGTERGMAGRGDGLASHLGAKDVKMEGKTREEVIKFFGAQGKSGTYIAWWSKHCIAVRNGTVHEFSESKGRYNTSPAVSYGWPKTGNFIRKL